jgi:uncharacterized protein (DUF2336 family)
LEENLHQQPSQLNSGLTLSPEDVNHLLSDKTSGTRVNMTHKIGGAYNTNGLGIKEIKVAEQIFRLLLRDTELNVRSSLAQYVKDSPNIPRDIVVKMAKDVEEVSLPILQFSEVLTDDDLVELVHFKDDISRYLAVSKRRIVSEKLADTLIAKGSEEVATALVYNSGATLSESGFSKIIDTYKGNEAMMQAVSNRSYLPISTVEKLISVVSGALSDTIKQKYNQPGQNIQKEVDKTRETETLHLIKHAESDDSIERLITQLLDANRLTPSIILSALCQGNFEFFETALARLSSIPVSNARKLITDRGELGFRAIYVKSGLPEAMFPAVKLLLKIVRDLASEGSERPGSSRYANSVVERILHASEDQQMENLSYIIALVRRIAQ